MKLVKLKLENFRGHEMLEVGLNSDLNMLIGKNDAGKSSILDALNIFFNEVKIDKEDCMIGKSKMNITCYFEIGEDKVVLDSSAPTSLKDEYLLNKDGLLEITKEVNASKEKVGSADVKVTLKCNYPVNYKKALITLKISELKNILEDNNKKISGYDDINKSIKSEIRLALFKFWKDQGVLNLEERGILIKEIEESGLKKWDQLKTYLPLYTLFESDRRNNDSDKEVQDPMKAITKEVLSTVESELNNTFDKITEEVQKIGNDTIEKLKDFNPDIAEALNVITNRKTLDTLFSFKIDTEEGVPLNKRGSGVRRLILLSYFRAEAERKAKEGNRNIIYAIEEPETAQHPDNQKMIIESLKEISIKKNHQIFLTTHTPEMAKMVSKDSLILLKKDSDKKTVVINDEGSKIQEIVETLGILPTIHSKVVLCVEGDNDINFLVNISKSIPELKDIIDLTNQEEISLMSMRGANLIRWINEDHFKNSGTKEYHLYDNDKEDYRDKIEKINKENDGRRKGKITQMYEMENYIPIPLIEKEFLPIPDSSKEKYSEFDLPKFLKENSMTNIDCLDEREKVIKMKINGSLSKEVTKELLVEHGVYDEIKVWFEEIKEFIL